MQNNEVVRILRACIAAAAVHLRNDDRTIAQIRTRGRKAGRVGVLRRERQSASTHRRRGHPNLMVAIDEHTRRRGQRRHSIAGGRCWCSSRERNAGREVVKRNLNRTCACSRSGLSRQGGEVHRRRKRHGNGGRGIRGCAVCWRRAHNGWRRCADAIGIACRATHRACRSNRNGRIRGSTGSARVGRTFIAVDKHVRVVVDADHGARSVALILFAITGHLIARRRTRGRVVESAISHRARAGLAFCIHPRTGVRHEALHARTSTIAQRSAALHTRASGRRGRIRGYARRADVVGAVVSVNVHVRVVVGVRRDVACPVALIGLAIARHGIGDDSTARDIVDTTHSRRTRMDLACRIRTTLASGVALDALARSVAECPTTRRTRCVDGFGRMHRHACIARIIGALVAIIRGYVGIVRHRYNHTRAIALFDLTIACRLTGNHRAIHCIVESAGPTNASSRLTFGIHSGAIARDHALRRGDAITARVALRTASLVTSCPGRHIRMRRRSGDTHFRCALLPVVHGHIVVVNRACGDATHAIALIGSAIAYGWIVGNRAAWGVAHAAHGVRACTRLAYRVHSGTIGRHVALHACPSRIADSSATLATHRPRRNRRMRHARHRVTRICRARIAIIRGDWVLHRTERHVTCRGGAGIVIVGRQIAPIEDSACAAHAIADCGLAIVRRLILQNRALCSIRKSACARSAGPHLAFRVHARAIGGLVATAFARSVADKRHTRTAHRTGGRIHIRSDAALARIYRAIILIIGYIGIVIDRRDVARAVALVRLAIFRHLRRSRCTGTDEHFATYTGIARRDDAFVWRSRTIPDDGTRHATATSSTAAAHSCSSTSAACAAHSGHPTATAHSCSSTSATSATHARSATAAAAASAAAAAAASLGLVRNGRSIHLGKDFASHAHRADGKCGCS